MGALIQLVSFGTLDVALVGEPRITFFKSKYKQYSNFALQEIEQVFNGTADFGKRATAMVSRSADLMAGAIVETTLPALATADIAGAGEIGYVNSIGHAIIDEVALKVGGNDVDKQYGEWLEICSHIKDDIGKDSGYNEMVGKGDSDASIDLDGNAAYERIYYTPLRFFFSKPGLAIPLIALEFNEVKLVFDFQQAEKCVKSNVGGSTFVNKPQFVNCKLYIEYVFLENEERAQLIDEPQSYLITQLQKQSSDTISWASSLVPRVESGSFQSVRLNFNLPCKEIIWVAKLDKYTATDFATGNMNFKYSEGFGPLERDILGTCVLQVNNQDRFSQRDATYFRMVQPWKHHTKTPGRQIHVYSFALNPDSFQPSGSLNYSKVDNSILKIKTMASSAVDTGVIDIYAVNLNTFNIREGVSGQGFAA